MPDTIKVFFATNRNRLADQNGQAAFGEVAGPTVQGLVFGAATVENVGLVDPGDGQITACEVMNSGAIGPELSAQILDGGNDILVFMHGAANTFQDALQRAAFNCNWINAEPGRNVTVLVFSWPARHYDFLNLLGDLVNYRLDQRQAEASAAHCVEFLGALGRFQPALGGRRLMLLAHSMGNYVLGFGIERWFATPVPVNQLFDSIILAAADEQSDTFALADGRRLANLRQITPRIAVYSSREDVLMLASRLVNGNFRLGFDGPPNRADRTFFPPGMYEFLDCTANRDFTDPFLASPDRTHQYYRQSVSVRQDVARVLKGVAAPAGARTFDAVRNVFSLPILGV
jgi:esterase/lipase superfamily enzyme